MAFLVVGLVLLVLAVTIYVLTNRIDVEPKTPAPEPEETKTIYEWLKFWEIPDSNIFQWDVPGYGALDEPVTKSAFTRWYRRASSLNDYVNRNKYASRR